MSHQDYTQDDEKRLIKGGMSYSRFISRYPFPDDENLNGKLYRKKELNEIHIPKRENPPPLADDKTRQPMSHQKLISRLMSEFSLIDEQLIYHGVGSGKTMTAIHLVESLFKKEGSSLSPPALILVPGPLLKLTFIREIMKYSPSLYEETERERMTRLRRNKKFIDDEKEKGPRPSPRIRQRYHIMTYRIFYNRYFSSSNEAIKKRAYKMYSNSVVVLDEVHTIRSRENYKGQKNDNVDIDKVYRSIHEFLHSIKNTKKILMSATPMRDDVQEISYIMNLILPLDKQININKKKFLKTYYDGGEHLTEEGRKKLAGIFKGRVSYISPPRIEGVVKEFQGEKKWIKYMRLYGSKLQGIQREVYLNLINENEGKEVSKDFFNKERQAINFVFPDGSYGNLEDKLKCSIAKSKIGDEKKKTEIDYFRFGCDFKDFTLRGNTHEEKLEDLKNYSIKYAMVIKQILDNKDKCIFVYFNIVRGSGAILFAKILKSFFGFKRYKINRNTTGINNNNNNVFEIMSSYTTTQKHNQQVLNVFNDPNNKDGKLIRVLIGSKTVGTGISIFNAQQCHIVTPFWNFSETEQAIGRVLRLDSFKHFDDEVTVKIFLHAAYLNEEEDEDETIDIKMYTFSQKKDILIKRMERMIKESATDCPFAYERNYNDQGEDNSRDCEYERCEYKCIGDYKNTTIDEDTYNLYYNRDNVERIKKRLIALFKKKPDINENKYHLFQLHQYIVSEFNMFTLLQGLHELISTNTLIEYGEDKGGYLREEDDVYFLVNEPSAGINLLLTIYDHLPYVYKDRTVQEKILLLGSDTINTILQEMKQGESKEEIYLTFKKLSPTLQELVIELSLPDIKNKPLYLQTLVSILRDKKEIEELINGRWKSYLITSKTNKVYRIMNEEGNWETRENFEYHGFIDKNGVFRLYLKEIGTESKKLPKGSVCSDKNSTKLAEILNALNINIDKGQPIQKQQQCEAIRARLVELNRLTVIE